MPEDMQSCFSNIVRMRGHEINKGDTVLDFGCGNGSSVKVFLDKGIKAYGCDFAFKDGPDVEALSASKNIRIISDKPYKLPFKDNSFDFIYSNQVFEHVQNYEETLKELKRVLKQGGVCMHIFPPKWKVIESHVHVPFASVIKSRNWLMFWYFLGVGKHNGRRSIKENAIRHEKYLKTKTNYLNAREIKKHFKKYFDKIEYGEKEFLSQTERKQGVLINRFAKKIPLIYWIYRECFSRILIVE